MASHTQLAVDITKRAPKTPNEKQGSIVIVTGDADVIPALDEVLKEEVWNVDSGVHVAPCTIQQTSESKLREKVYMTVESGCTQSG